MTRADQGRRGWITRRGYGAAAFAVGLFIVYGSLVPLQLRSVTFGEALREFSDALSSPLIIDSRADFVTNILLTIPLAYLMLAAFMTDRGGRLRRLAASVPTLVCCFALSVSVEFAQVFSQGRTDSLSDIVAQAAGAVVGVALWLAIGDVVTLWLRESLEEREEPALIQRILLIYCVLFAISQLMPLDLTISVAQLARKYRRGMILLRPFTYNHPTTFDMWWDYLGDVVLNVPVGAAAVLLWVKNRARRPALMAFGLGVAAVVVVEVAQVFVNSRFADSTDVITGSLGVATGVVLATMYSPRRQAATLPRSGAAASVRFARIGVAAWIVVLMSYHWNPFNFTANADRVTLGMHQLLSVPFYSYYLGSEFHAFTEMLRKFLLAAPLGALLRLSWSSSNANGAILRMKFVVAAVFGFLVLVGIELGQVFLPTRTPDLTDAMIGEIGLVVAMWLTHRLSVLRAEQSPVGRAVALPSQDPRI